MAWMTWSSLSGLTTAVISFIPRACPAGGSHCRVLAPAPQGPTACSSHGSRAWLSANRAGQMDCCGWMKACPVAAALQACPSGSQRSYAECVEDPGGDFPPLTRVSSSPAVSGYEQCCAGWRTRSRGSAVRRAATRRGLAAAGHVGTGDRAAGLAGGVLLAASPDGSLLRADPAVLADTPFTDWRVPGVLLAGLVGGGFLLAGWWQ